MRFEPGTRLTVEIRPAQAGDTILDASHVGVPLDVEAFRTNRDYQTLCAVIVDDDREPAEYGELADRREYRLEQRRRSYATTRVDDAREDLAAGRITVQQFTARVLAINSQADTAAQVEEATR